MGLLSSGKQEAVICHFLGQRMLEYVFKLRKKSFLIDEFKALKVEEVGFEFLSNLGDGLNDAKGKIAPDYRCDLHGSFEVVFQPVHACSNDCLDCVRHPNI